MTNLSINDGQSTMTPKDSGKDGGLWAKKVCCMSAGKWCTLCAVASVVVMVSIPVGVLVVGPMIAQKILHGTTISLPNSTISTCTTQHALVQNIAKINVPFFLPSTLLQYKQVLSTTMCNGGTKGGYACANPTVVEIGSYVSPSMHLSGGESTQIFESTMDLPKDNPFAAVIGLVMPLFNSPGVGDEKIHLILSAKDVTISVLGIKLKGLTMHNELTCTGEKVYHKNDGQAIPNEVCHPKQLDYTPLDKQPGYMMSCVAGALPIANFTTTTAPTTSGATIIF
jgi:hypothetical protein